MQCSTGKNRHWEKNPPACLRRRKWDNKLYYKMTAGSIPAKEYYPELEEKKRNTGEVFGKARER